MGKIFLVVLCLTTLPIFTWAEDAATAAHCIQWLDKFEGLLGKDPHFSVLRESGKIDGTLYYEAKGIPRTAKWRLVEPGEVFRHYVADMAALNSILQSTELRAGNRPYLEGGGESVVVFKDLTGIFLTTPEYNSHFVDAASSLYVDFTLPPGTKVLELREGISLLPGPPSTASWLMTQYEKWKKDPKSVDSLYISEMKKMDQAGVMIPRYQKIHVVSHSLSHAN